MEPKEKWLRLGEAVEVVVTPVTEAERLVSTGQAVLYCRTLDRNGRFLRSLRILGICWGLAVLSLPILVFHFVLVPGFLIAGLFFFFVCLKEDRVVLGAIVPCPACGESTRLKGRALDWPVQLDCGNCSRSLDLEPAGGEGEQPLRESG